VQHGDERVDALPPGVAVGDFFEDVGFIGEGFVANFDVHGEINADIEGGIDIDELDAALLFDFVAERAAAEGGEDELVVASDEFVGPALELAVAGIEEAGLESGVGGLFGARLIDLLDDLKGEGDVADFAGLAVPDELDFALVVEEEEAVVVREGPTGFEMAQDVADFVVAELHALLWIVFAATRERTAGAGPVIGIGTAS
jgi:hypothetical protein